MVQASTLRAIFHFKTWVPMLLLWQDSKRCDITDGDIKEARQGVYPEPVGMVSAESFVGTLGIVTPYVY